MADLLANRGGTTTSTSFDVDWHSGSQVLHVYIKTDIVVLKRNGPEKVFARQRFGSRRCLPAFTGVCEPTAFRLERLPSLVHRFSSDRGRPHLLSSLVDTF